MVVLIIGTAFVADAVSGLHPGIAALTWSQSKRYDIRDVMRL
jgi:hypothetical protein